MTAPEKKRRQKGAGGLSQRAADGMWCASVELPSPDGKRRRKVIVRARKDDALAALREARRELERSGDLLTATPTLATWLDLWFTRIASPRLKVSTRPGYRGNIDRYLVPSIGRVRLDKLTPAHVRRMHEYVTADPPTGLGLSPTTALQAHRILAKALTDAEREGCVNRNVAGLVDAPRKARTTKAYLDGPQARTLLEHSGRTDPETAARWVVAFLTGCRPGERLGLTEDQVDFDRNIVTIAWQLQRLAFEHGCDRASTAPDAAWMCGRKRGGNCPQRTLDVPRDQEVRPIDGGLYLTRPKSRAGLREVLMAPLLREVLARLIASRPTGIHGLVFTRDGTRPVDPSDDAKTWHAALAAAALPAVSPHSARHSCATLLDELGVPQNVREQILGHAGGAATAIYTHVADARTAAAMHQLGELLGPEAP